MNSFGRDRPLLSLACQALTTNRSWIRCIKLQCEAETCTHILPRFELWYGFPANDPVRVSVRILPNSERGFLRPFPALPMLALANRKPPGHSFHSGFLPRSLAGRVLSWQLAWRRRNMLPVERLLFLWLGLHPCETETSSIISSPVRFCSFSPSSSLVRI
jgi:hypothetical protein